MKKAKLQDVIEWEGRMYQVVAINTGHRSICMKSLDKNTCIHCGQDNDHDFMDVIEDSPHFQENAKPVKTITED